MEFLRHVSAIPRSIRTFTRLVNNEVPSANYVGVERRRFPRIQIFGQIQGQVLPLNVQITVIDFSLAGLCFQTTVCLPIGRLLELSLTLDDGESLIIPARVIRSLRTNGTDGVTHYFTGLELISDQTLDTQRAIERSIAVAAAQIRALTDQLTALAARLQRVEAQPFSTHARGN